MRIPSIQHYWQYIVTMIHGSIITVSMFLHIVSLLIIILYYYNSSVGKHSWFICDGGPKNYK